MPTKKATKKTAATKASKKVVRKAAAKATKTTKKTAAKKAPKKTAAKKATKAAAKNAKAKTLVCAKGADCFWVHDGPILKDLQELEQALADMSEEMFGHHVGKGRHDFADWVEQVLKDVETAAALRTSKKPQTAHKVVVRQLKLYKLPSK